MKKPQITPQQFNPLVSPEGKGVKPEKFQSVPRSRTNISLRQDHSIMDKIKLPLSAVQAERIRSIESEDLHFVEENVRKELPTIAHSDASVGIIELKKYYTLCVLDPINMKGVSRTVDPFWHSHILHTSEYRAFCERVFGAFLDHEPLNPKSLARVRRVRKAYSRTREVMAKVFGTVNEFIWPSLKSDSSAAVCVHYSYRDPRLVQDSPFAAVRGLARA